VAHLSHQKLFYANKYQVGDSTVFVDENDIVVGVSVCGEFPDGVIIGEVYSPPPTAEERLTAIEDAILALLLGG
jgi:hypothetical protein